jgi:hypothetical protein
MRMLQLCPHMLDDRAHLDFSAAVVVLLYQRILLQQLPRESSNELSPFKPKEARITESSTILSFLEVKNRSNGLRDVIDFVSKVRDDSQTSEVMKLSDVFELAVLTQHLAIASLAVFDAGEYREDAKLVAHLLQALRHAVVHSIHKSPVKINAIRVVTKDLFLGDHIGSDPGH